MDNQLTSPANRDESRDVSVDAIFARLATMYGRHWLEMWVGIPLNAVKAEWSARLERMPPQAIRLAMDALLRDSKFPPTLPEFYSLCVQLKPVVPAAMRLTDNRRDPPPPHVAEAIRAMLKRKL